MSSVVGADLQMNQVVLAPVVPGHSGERLPIDPLFVNAQAAPRRLVLEDLVRELVDSRAGFA